MSEQKVYPKPEDLGEGKHRVKVFPKPEFEDGKPVKDSQKTGTSKTGFKWYMYQFKDPTLGYVSLFANDENKELFDSGEVELNIVQKVDRATKRPVFDVVDGKPVKVLKYFVNAVQPQSKPQETIPGVEAKYRTEDAASDLENGENLPPLPF